MNSREWGAFVALSLIWGTSYLWIAVALQQLSPFTLVALRLLIGVLGAAVILLLSRQRLPSNRNMLLSLAFLGIMNTALPFVLITWGQQTVDSAVTSVLVATAPLFTLILAHFFLSDDRITATKLIGLLVGFVGVLILLSRDFQPGGLGTSMVGQIAILLAALVYAFSAVFARSRLKGINPLVQALVPLAVADLFVWVGVALFETPVQLPTSGLIWFALIWLGLLGSSVAYVLYFFLIQNVGPTQSSLVTYSIALIGVMLGVLILNEALNWQLAVGSALVISGIGVVNWQPRRTKQANPIEGGGTK